MNETKLRKEQNLLFRSTPCWIQDRGKWQR